MAGTNTGRGEGLKEEPFSSKILAKKVLQTPMHVQWLTDVSNCLGWAQREPPLSLFVSCAFQTPC